MGKKKNLKKQIIFLQNRVMQIHNEKTILQNQIYRNVSDYRNATTDFEKQLREKNQVINDLQNMVNKHHVLVPSIMQTNDGVPNLNNTTEYWTSVYSKYYDDHDSYQAVELTITDMINHFNTYILWKQSNVSK